MTPDEALAALDALSPGCARCRKFRREVAAALTDRRTVARRAAHDQHGRDWTRHLEKTARELAGQLAWAEEHLSEPHEAPATKDAEPVHAVEPEPDTRPTCPRCGVRVEVNASGRIRLHRGPSGIKCPCRYLTVEVETPPVSLRPAPSFPPRPSTTSRPARPKHEPSRLDVGSECEDCGRWLPGERKVCGRCYVHRSSA